MGEQNRGSEAGSLAMGTTRERYQERRGEEYASDFRGEGLCEGRCWVRYSLPTANRILRVFSSGREQLDWLLTKKPIGAYVGVDPTAPSMHVGHLLPFMALFWMYLNGYPSVTLVSTTHIHPKLELTL